MTTNVCEKSSASPHKKISAGEFKEQRRFPQKKQKKTRAVDTCLGFFVSQKLTIVFHGGVGGQSSGFFSNTMMVPLQNASPAAPVISTVHTFPSLMRFVSEKKAFAEVVG